jgi:hypothetical protein
MYKEPNEDLVTPSTAGLFARGALETFPLILAATPFAILYGALALNNGLFFIAACSSEHVNFCVCGCIAVCCSDLDGYKCAGAHYYFDGVCGQPSAYTLVNSVYAQNKTTTQIAANTDGLLDVR